MDGVDVGGETGQAEVDGRRACGGRRWRRGRRAEGEDLGEVVGHGEGLQAEAQVARDGDAVFAGHSDARAAVDAEGACLGAGVS